MELDTGNGSTTIFLAKYLAPLFGVDPDKKDPQPVKLTLVGGIAVETEARTLPNMIMDGNIGAKVLKRWVLTLDCAHQRAWLAPVGS